MGNALEIQKITGITNVQYEKLEALLKRYKEGHLIYTSAIMRSLSVERSTALSILEQLELLGIVEQRFEIVCPKCDKGFDELFQQENMPDILYCPECDCEITANGNNRLVYKVSRIITEKGEK